WRGRWCCCCARPSARAPAGAKTRKLRFAGRRHCRRRRRLPVPVPVPAGGRSCGGFTRPRPSGGLALPCLSGGDEFTGLDLLLALL
ncbi:unnamed protein product, partial [Ectocarpus sp. 12 AP-2014]